MPGGYLTATARIFVADAEVVEAMPNLVELRVVHDVGASSHARLRFDVDRDPRFPFEIGKDLKVEVVSDGDTTIFSGEILSVGLDYDLGRRELIVDAYDKSYRLAQTTLSKSHLNQQVKDVIAYIAGQTHLSSDVSAKAAALNQPFDSTIQQFGTARHFLAEFCRISGCEWLVDGDKLIVRDRSSDTDSVTVTAGDDLIRFTTRFSAMDQVEEVVVRGWDPGTKREIIGKALGENVAKPSNINMAKAKDQRDIATTWPRPLLDQTDAESVAAGVTHRMGSTGLQARGVVEVKPEIVTGSRVKVEDLGDEWSGSYYITGVEHIFRAGDSFITKFTTGGLEPTSLVDLLGRGPDSNTARFTEGLTIGIVTNNEDSEMSLNRVKVTFPYLSDSEESSWARLALPGAGKSRGLMMLPEIDDEVLVGFEHGDIGRPYILGGLWNGKDEPPMDTEVDDLVMSGNVTTRSLTSRNGHRLELVDTEPEGDHAELALNDEVAQLWLGDERIDIIHAKEFPITIKNEKASIEMTGAGDITLKGENVTIEAAKNLTLKATGDIKATSTGATKIEATSTFSAKGTSGVKVESPATTEVKGLMVKIN